MKLAEFTNKCHMAAHFSEINLDSSIMDAIILTNLIFLAGDAHIKYKMITFESTRLQRND